MKIEIPTAITAGETELLQRIATDKHVVEIGALFGYSTIALAQVAKRVISIDPHFGYPNADSPSTRRVYQENLAKYKMRHHITPVISTWQAAFRTLPAEILFPYQVVFIDLDGTYETTQECLQYFAPEWGWSLQTIAVHDCNHPEWPGVDRAVDWMKERLGPYHYTFEQVDKLGVFRYV